MKDWMPLLQSCVWPAFIGAFLIWFKIPFVAMIKALQERILAGAPFEAGPIKIGQAPKLAAVVDELSVRPADVERPERGANEQNGGATLFEPGNMYLVHTARRVRNPDSPAEAFYNVRLYLDADEQGTLDGVSEVTYYLHPSFKEPVRVVPDRKTSFELRLRIWGEFNVAANVHLKIGENRRLERYLNV